MKEKLWTAAAVALTVSGAAVAGEMQSGSSTEMGMEFRQRQPRHQGKPHTKSAERNAAWLHLNQAIRVVSGDSCV